MYSASSGPLKIGLGHPGLFPGQGLEITFTILDPVKNKSDVYAWNYN